MSKNKNDISFSLKNKKKKYHFNISETFDFNDIENNDNELNDTIISNVKIDVIKELSSNGLSFFKKILKYNLNCYRFEKYGDNIYNADKFTYQYFLLYKLANFIKYNNWRDCDIFDYENVLSYYKLATNPNANCYVSPDDGIIYVDDHYNVPYFLYTGNVEYTVNKSHTINYNILYKIFGELINKNIKGHNFINSYLKPGFLFVNDKDGYPYLATVIISNNLYENLPDIFYHNIHTEEYWSNALKSSHSSVKLRRNSKDGLLEFGVFFPWDPDTIFKNNTWEIYNRKYYSFNNTHIDIIKLRYMIAYFNEIH